MRTLVALSAFFLCIWINIEPIELMGPFPPHLVFRKIKNNAIEQERQRQKRDIGSESKIGLYDYSRPFIMIILLPVRTFVFHDY